MFTIVELNQLAECIETELWFLLKVERSGVPTVGHQAAITALRLKALELAAQQQKADQAAAAEEAKKRSQEKK